MNIPVIKNTEERLVPRIWRKTLSDIVDAFVDGDFELKTNIEGVSPISSEDAIMIAENIEDYGVQLKKLPEQTWNTSVSLWMDGFWDIFVDLYSEEEDASDLVLNVRVYEKNSEYIFNIYSVFVP
jgi:hypothetical protein